MAPNRRMSLPYDQRIRPERKEQLKKALMNHAKKECLAIKAARKEGKAQALEERVPAFPDVDALDDDALKQLCRDLHAMCDRTDETLYDLEVKHEKSVKESEDLNKRVADIKAKFQKPTLKRVKMSVTQMLTSILGNKTAQVDMRSNLKTHAPINE
jgi:predicted nuclease with TOPRIM domain